jgi:exonuclease III
MDDNSCDRFFHPFDIVGLVHTGCVSENEANVVSSSHECVYIRSRPLSPQSGGHAIYARKQIARYIKVVCDHIEHGVVWLHVTSPTHARKGLFVAFVYIPPQSSTYFHQAEGLSYDEHFLRIQQDIMDYQNRGRVLIMGDFNARTGTLNEWDLLDPHILRHYDKMDIKPRKSRDKVLNSSGKRLVALCESTCMFMLNGRSQSDVKGMISFHEI